MHDLMFQYRVHYSLIKKKLEILAVPLCNSRRVVTVNFNATMHDQNIDLRELVRTLGHRMLSLGGPRYHDDNYCYKGVACLLLPKA